MCNLIYIFFPKISRLYQATFWCMTHRTEESIEQSRGMGMLYFKYYPPIVIMSKCWYKQVIPTNDLKALSPSFDVLITLPHLLRKLSFLVLRDLGSVCSWMLYLFAFLIFTMTSLHIQHIPELHLKYAVLGLYQAICLSKQQKNLDYTTCSWGNQALHNSVHL